jgi:hypothetical protein
MRRSFLNFTPVRQTNADDAYWPVDSEAETERRRSILMDAPIRSAPVRTEWSVIMEQEKVIASSMLTEPLLAPETGTPSVPDTSVFVTSSGAAVYASINPSSCDSAAPVPFQTMQSAHSAVATSSSLTASTSFAPAATTTTAAPIVAATSAVCPGPLLPPSTINVRAWGLKERVLVYEEPHHTPAKDDSQSSQYDSDAVRHDLPDSLFSAFRSAQSNSDVLSSSTSLPASRPAGAPKIMAKTVKMNLSSNSTATSLSATSTASSATVNTTTTTPSAISPSHFSSSQANGTKKAMAVPPLVFPPSVAALLSADPPSNARGGAVESASVFADSAAATTASMGEVQRLRELAREAEERQRIEELRRQQEETARQRAEAKVAAAREAEEKKRAEESRRQEEETAKKLADAKVTAVPELERERADELRRQLEETARQRASEAQRLREVAREAEERQRADALRTQRETAVRERAEARAAATAAATSSTSQLPVNLDEVILEAHHYMHLDNVNQRHASFFKAWKHASMDTDDEDWLDDASPAAARAESAAKSSAHATTATATATACATATATAVMAAAAVAEDEMHQMRRLAREAEERQRAEELKRNREEAARERADAKAATAAAAAAGTAAATMMPPPSSDVSRQEDPLQKHSAPRPATCAQADDERQYWQTMYEERQRKARARKEEVEAMARREAKRQEEEQEIKRRQDERVAELQWRVYDEYVEAEKKSELQSVVQGKINSWLKKLKKKRPTVADYLANLHLIFPGVAAYERATLSTKEAVKKTYMKVWAASYQIQDVSVVTH